MKVLIFFLSWDIFALSNELLSRIGVTNHFHVFYAHRRDLFGICNLFPATHTHTNFKRKFSLFWLLIYADKMWKKRRKWKKKNNNVTDTAQNRMAQKSSTRIRYSVLENLLGVEWCYFDDMISFSNSVLFSFLLSHHAVIWWIKIFRCNEIRFSDYYALHHRIELLVWSFSL